MGYYFISIGGSGAKVLESLTHLTVAGLLPNHEKQQKLYVMAIDPDIGNGNLKRASTVLTSFESFQDWKVGNDTPLFKTEVTLARPLIWNPAEHDQKLDDVLSYQAYRGTPVGALYEVLFSKEERETFLNEGFRGRPSIGAAVLAKRVALDNRRKDRDVSPWESFARLIRQDVKSGQTAKIFLAGSVFGGTGASGLPTIAKLLRKTFANYFDDGDVLIGGAFLLPYFSFAPDKDTQQKLQGEIYAQAENFSMNTRAALEYYSVREKNFHSMYFVGDDVLSQMKNFSIGAATQMNESHIVDLYGALAAIDFYQSELDSIKSCSFIARAEENRFTWTDLPNVKMDSGEEIRVKDRLGQLARFVFAYIHLVKPVLKDLSERKINSYRYPWYLDYLEDVDTDTDAMKSFDTYVDRFVHWIAQIEGMESASNGRAVELINKTSFTSDPIGVVAENFSSCIHGEDVGISIHELWYRLCEESHDVESASGIGKFIRALYDSCAAKV
ncbi:MAG: hypothetical protein IJ575_11400 [Selenomonadaceae bacterium]|nr:hypothetical protein [Selenomonadaceae bacterium]